MTENYLKQLRQSLEFSTQYVSEKIGVSRPTYVAIEKGSKDMTLAQAEKLAKLFNLSFEDFLNKKDPKKYTLKIKKGKKKDGKVNSEIRISIPQENVEKFKAVFLYLLGRIGAKPNVGETVLYKLLYFIDFDYYEKFEEQLMGVKYIKNHFGPTPVGFHSIVKQMQDDGELEKVDSTFFNREQKKYLPKKNADLSNISAQELKHIEEVIARYSDMNAADISELSHEDPPWVVARMNEELRYNHVFYRNNKTSVREYGSV